MKSPCVPLRLPIDNFINAYNLDDIVNTTNNNIRYYNSLLDNTHLDIDLIIKPKILLNEDIPSNLSKSYIPERDKDYYQEEINKYNAYKLAEELLNSSNTVNIDLFKNINRELLKYKVRGSRQNPGRIRTVQNHIGRIHSKIEDAIFIPPSPENVHFYLDNLIEYINNPKDKLDNLIRFAIIHGQYEIIHPFLDGNGRFGRILGVLFLYYTNTLNHFQFSIDDAVNVNKNVYYTLLNGLTEIKANSPKNIKTYIKNKKLVENAWIKWINYYIKTLNTQIESNIKLIKRIDALYIKTKQRLYLDNSVASNLIIDYIFSQPIFSIEKIQNDLNASYDDLKKYINILYKKRIINYNDNKYYFDNLLEDIYYNRYNN